MNIILLVLLVLGSALAGNVAVNLDPLPERDGDWLVYDNGTPAWVSWDGTYRGVWFNTEDFIPGGISGMVQEAELWFYHSSDYPWDTGNVYIELWDGGSTGPQSFLIEQTTAALHYSPVYVSFWPAVADPEFWVVINTELSTGGWPSILSDGAQAAVPHSFYSDDFTVWEPWEKYGVCNYFVAVLWGNALNPITWAILKTTF